MTERFARIPIRAAGISLGAVPLRVLIAISGHADAEGRAYPGMGMIAGAAGIRREDVPRAIASLERAGLLRRERAPGGRMTTTVYIILFDGDGVSAAERTESVRTTADRVSAPQHTGCPQGSVRGVRTTADQTNKNIPMNRHTSRRRADMHASQSTANDDFETFWRIFPSRGGHSNPKKPAREKFDTLVKDGVEPGRLILAAGNYRATMLKSGKFGSEFVMQAKTFLGRDRRWEQFADLEDEPDLPLAAGMI
jgi:hypothetical protein